MTNVIAPACISDPVKNHEISKLLTRPRSCQLTAFNNDFRFESCMALLWRKRLRGSTRDLSTKFYIMDYDLYNRLNSIKWIYISNMLKMKNG